MSIESDEVEMKRHRSAIEEISRRDLQDFLDWLANTDGGERKNKVCLCIKREYSATNGFGEKYFEYEPVSLEGGLGQKLFAEYFGVDLDAVERFRQRLLENMMRDYR